VRNSSDVVAEYALDILGPAREWTEVIPSRVSVLRRGETTAQLQFRPPEGTPAGTVPFALRCVSRDDEQAALAEGDIAVGAIHDLTASITPSVVRHRWSGRWTARFDNRGTAPVRLALEVEDERHTLGFRLAPTELRLGPGQSGLVYVKGRTAQPSLLGSPARQRVKLTYAQLAEPGDVAALDGAYNVGPRRVEGFVETAFEQTRVLSRLVVTVGALALAGGLAALALLSRSSPQDRLAPSLAPPVAPASFDARAGDRPGVVRLSWSEVPGAIAYNVFPVESAEDGARRGVARAVPAPSTVYEWEGLAADKPSCFVVTAQNKGGSSTASPARCATGGAGAVAPTGTPTGQSPAANPTVQEPIGAYAVLAAFVKSDAPQDGNQILAAKQQIDTTLAGYGYDPSILADVSQSTRLSGQYRETGTRVIYLDGFRTVADARNFCAQVKADLTPCVPSTDAGSGDGSLTVSPPPVGTVPDGGGAGEPGPTSTSGTDGSGADAGSPTTPAGPPQGAGG
jgi:hypothetical protein